MLTTAAIGTLVATVLAAGGAATDGQGTSLLFSSGVRDPLTALVNRAIEWGLVGVLSQTLSVFGAVAFGAWVARYRVLDEPRRHRRLLARVAVGGLTVAVLGGLPLALAAAGAWSVSPAVGALVHGLHSLSGTAGGLGYAALFGLLAIRATGTGGPLAAAGRWSLSCYLAQSVVFVVLLPAWTLDLGARLAVWQVSALAVATWAATVGLAAAAERRGLGRGPAERVLRRLTYGPR
ncbi:MAG: DUF418 domain-containing protein [Pseudonocardia sp.]|nr:DUF418 domain-containing protein [Pseudonocardia sp.]